MKSKLIIKNYNNKIKESMPLALFVYSDKLDDYQKEIINDEYVEKVYEKMVADKLIKGEVNEAPYIYGIDSKFNKFYFIGLGDSKKVKLENFRKAGAALSRRLRKFYFNKVSVKFPEFENLGEKEVENRIQAFIEGFMLRNYDFCKYREKSHEGHIDELYIIENNKKFKKSVSNGIKIGEIMSKATNLCRDIANEPANFMTPEEMANRTKEFSKNYPQKLKCKIYNKKDLEKFGMGCFLGVSKAGSVPPKMIVLEYFNGKKGEAPIALIGKGVTFDSGGISLKNASGMFHMKRDMSGASAVLGSMLAVAELDLKVNVVAIVGATENMIGSQAYKPGDILFSMSGKTVEITNTDAEGRLVLADLFTYAQEKYKPSSIIDLATLTGAVARALGGRMSGVFSNNRDLLDKIKEASIKSNELLWELPLGNDLYKKANKSYFGDIKNSSAKPPGGTKAALFLYEFIQDDLPWVHLDIAGTETASGEPAGYYPRGATGVGTRTLVEFLKNISES